MSRPVHVYRLVIDYPEGSRQSGWRPAVWRYPPPDTPRKIRRYIRRAEFRWPRERMFLSSSGAYQRAGLLRWYGASVEVERSLAVEWPGYLPPDCMDAMDGWTGDVWPEFDASGIPREKVSQS